MTPSSGYGQSPAAVDSAQVLTDAYRSIKHENIDLKKELVDLRADLLRSESHRQADNELWAEKERWLKEQVPAWYQQPGFVAVVVAVVTVWATLQAVQISL